MDAILADEIVHANRKRGPLTLDEVLTYDLTGDVILHNTMRFDVNLAHVQVILDEGDVDKTQIVEAIRSAIIDAVDRVLGVGLDGRPIPGGATFFDVKQSVMLHRETISFDLG